MVHGISSLNDCIYIFYSLFVHGASKGALSSVFERFLQACIKRRQLDVPLSQCSYFLELQRTMFLQAFKIFQVYRIVIKQHWRCIPSWQPSSSLGVLEWWVLAWRKYINPV